MSHGIERIVSGSRSAKAEPSLSVVLSGAQLPPYEEEIIALTEEFQREGLSFQAARDKARRVYADLYGEAE